LIVLIVRSGTPLHCTAAKDFLGNGRVRRGLVAIALGLGTRPERARDIQLPVVSATLVAGTPPQGFWTNGKNIISVLCARNDMVGVTVCSAP